MENNKPVWIRGYRCHSLRMNGIRIGFVRLSVEHRKPVIVSWSFNLPFDDAQKGTCGNVRKGKQLVNRAYAAYLAKYAEWKGA
jgi:hypothetical protein